MSKKPIWMTQEEWKRHRSEVSKTYYRKNRDDIRERQRRFAVAHYETYRARWKVYNLKHRERRIVYLKEYRAKKPDKIQESRRRHKLRVLQAVVAGGIEKITGKEIPQCAACGCNQIEFLEINHVNGGGRKETNKLRGPFQDYILKTGRKTDDLNILCRVCNALDYLKRKFPNENYPSVRWNGELLEPKKK